METTRENQNANTTRRYHCNVCGLDEPFRDPSEHKCGGKHGTVTSMATCQGGCSKCMRFCMQQTNVQQTTEVQQTMEEQRPRPRKLAGKKRKHRQMKRAESDRRDADVNEVLARFGTRTSFTLAALMEAAVELGMDLQ